MEYVTPVVEIAGPAKEIVQAYLGPRTDGNGYIFSQGLSCTPDE